VLARSRREARLTVRVVGDEVAVVMMFGSIVYGSIVVNGYLHI
jgi:hypothetical protein